MDLKKLGEVPKSYVKEILNSLSKLDKLKKVPFFTGIHFKDTEEELNKKIDDYRKVDRESGRIWKIVELSRNDVRPQCQDYIRGIFTDFTGLSGNRLSMEDQSIIAGLGKIGGRTVAIIGHNKGRDIKERVKYNFGSSVPQGYRKSQRIMKLAGRFGFPVITFVDTPGAYAGIDAEDSGQSSAIAHSIQLMFELKVPVIVVLIGEGGSGGALGIGIGNRILILEHAYYSVISPEGCAAILWKDRAFSDKAAEALKITGQDLLKLKLADEIIPEPKGGAHADHEAAAENLKAALNSAGTAIGPLSD